MRPSLTREFRCVPVDAGLLCGVAAIAIAISTPQSSILGILVRVLEGRSRSVGER